MAGTSCGRKEGVVEKELDLSSQHTKMVTRIGEPLATAAQDRKENDSGAMTAVMRRMQNKTSPPSGIETNETRPGSKGEAEETSSLLRSSP